ncbi:MAG: hypothetical protein QXK93_04815 [Candidatus Bathyarchaeia archaeon]
MLVFKDDVAVTLTPVSKEASELLDRIFGGMVVEKWTVWCG